jgi:predicted phage gp36 major capsid-like protein
MRPAGGIITALVGTSSIVTSATTDVFARADVYATQNALPARFSGRAQWCAHIATINAISQSIPPPAPACFPRSLRGGC